MFSRINILLLSLTVSEENNAAKFAPLILADLS